MTLLKTSQKIREKNQCVQTAENSLGPQAKTLLNRFFFGTNATYITDCITAPANDRLNASTGESEKCLNQNKKSTRNKDANNSSTIARDNTAEEVEYLLRSFVPYLQATKKSNFVHMKEAKNKFGVAWSLCTTIKFFEEILCIYVRSIEKIVIVFLMNCMYRIFYICQSRILPG